MEKKITVSITTDITIAVNEEEEKLLDAIDNASWSDTFDDDKDVVYDEAMDKLGELIEKRLENYGKDVRILDINWE